MLGLQKAEDLMHARENNLEKGVQAATRHLRSPLNYRDIEESVLERGRRSTAAP